MKTSKTTILLLLFVLLQHILLAQTLDVHIVNILNTKGQLCIAIFCNEADFKAEKPFWETKCQKGLVENGNFNIETPIKAGKYGISVLDDENQNGKMDYKLFRIPREGFGFSNYYQKGISKPSLDDFSFVVEKNETKLITIRMTYF